MTAGQTTAASNVTTSAATTTAAPRPPSPAAPAREDFTFSAPPAHLAPADPSAAATQEAQAHPSRALAWAAAATAVVVLSAFFVLIVSGRVVTEGPVVLVLSRTHGVHLGDLLALGAWCLATGGLLASVLVGGPLRRR